MLSEKGSVKSLKRKLGFKVVTLASVLLSSSFLFSGCTRRSSMTAEEAKYESQDRASYAYAHRVIQLPKKTEKLLNKQQNQLDNALGKINFESGKPPLIQVNHNKASLDIKNWGSNEIIYHPLDKSGRASGITTAFLCKRNVAKIDVAHAKYDPTGWNKDLGQQGIICKGQIISRGISNRMSVNGTYLPSGKVGYLDKRNTFTLTSFTQQEKQKYDEQVKQALNSNAKVIYQVMPVFWQNDKMPKGIWLQAIGSNGLNFNVYLFNVQPGYSFNYSNGQANKDPKMQVGKSQ